MTNARPMSAELLINVTPSETRVALIENGMLQEVFVERVKRRGLVGNIFKGRVSRVLPGMQAAFVDIGLERAAFLHASDIALASRRHTGRAERPASEPIVQPVDPEASDRPPSSLDPEPGYPEPEIGITELVSEGQVVLVQVVKEPLGTKGARLTTHVSIPSCFLVYMPDANTAGVSHRIEDEQERQRLRRIVRRFQRGIDENVSPNQEPQEHEADPAAAVPGGFIARTAAEGAPEEVLIADMAFLYKLWLSLQERTSSTAVPGVVHEDLPLAIRTMRELIGIDIERVRIDSRDMHDSIRNFAEQFIPEMVSRIEHYPGERPIFDLYGVEDEIQKALEGRVQLKSGGHLIIDQTEAMTTIDVNTGGYVGHRNLEETIFKTNLEAAQAIARQLRLRNLGGIIIIDFIDMVSEEHKRQVLRALEKNLERTHAKTQISEVSSLGLVQMTRKRTRESLEHVLCQPCPTCGGRGTVKTPETVCYEIFREIIREARQYDSEKLLVLASQEVIDTLVDEESASFAELEAFIGKPIELQVEALYTQDRYDVVLL